MNKLGNFGKRDCFSPALRRTLLLLSILLAASACTRTQLSGQRYSLTGKVVSVDPDKKQLIVSHDDIKGYMPAMIMPFTIKDRNGPPGLAKGDEIAATLVVAGSESWLENISITRKNSGAPDSRDLEIKTQPHPGDAVPDFTLINQDGKKISLHQYHGKTLLLTFIYTRCPLPDYCPLMSGNFAEIEKSLKKEPSLYAGTHLLSVSFDSKYDTPTVLRSYGAAYTEKYSAETFDHWEFASGSEQEVKAITGFFGLQYVEDSKQIVHSLVTAIISPDHKIVKVYSGNNWKPHDVLADLRGTKS
jgi:protein SCO1